MSWTHSRGALHSEFAAGDTDGEEKAAEPERARGKRRAVWRNVGPAGTDAAKENTDAAKENTDAGKGNTDAGKGNTDAAKGNTDAAKGNTDAGKNGMIPDIGRQLGHLASEPAHRWHLGMRLVSVVMLYISYVICIDLNDSYLHYLTSLSGPLELLLPAQWGGVVGIALGLVLVIYLRLGTRAKLLVAGIVTGMVALFILWPIALHRSLTDPATLTGILHQLKILLGYLIALIFILPLLLGVPGALLGKRVLHYLSITPLAIGIVLNDITGMAMEEPIGRSFVLSVAFGLTLLLYLEIGESALRLERLWERIRKMGDVHLTQLRGMRIRYIIATAIFVISILILLTLVLNMADMFIAMGRFTPWLLLNGRLANSLELHSIYGIAISTILILAIGVSVGTILHNLDDIIILLKRASRFIRRKGISGPARAGDTPSAGHFLRGLNGKR